MRARGCELLDHNFVDRVYKRFRKVAPANTRLIRDHNHGQSGFVQTADGIRNMRQDTKSADVIQVADFFGDGAVAIEKDGRAERASFSQDAPPPTKSNAGRRIRQRRE